MIPHAPFCPRLCHKIITEPPGSQQFRRLWISSEIMMIAVAVPFILTVIVGKRKGIGSVRAAETEISEKNDADSTEKAAEVKEITAFLSGKVIDITEVPDEVFSQKTLGDGVAIEPTDEVLVAPADAEVSIVMEGSNHACGLSLPNGMELLLHIGLDTVDMNGDGFTAHVKAGQDAVISLK